MPVEYRKGVRSRKCPEVGGERPFTGLTAAVKIAKGCEDELQTLAYISGVDLTLDKQIIEILAFGMEFKEKVPAVKDWTASVDGTVSLAKGTTQEMLYEAFDSGDPLSIGIFLSDNVYFEGVGYVSSFNISAAPDDKISISSEIAGTGATTLHIEDVVAGEGTTRGRVNM